VIPTLSTSRKLEDRYKELTPEREPYLRRARAFASLTVPSVCPPLGLTGSADLPESYTSFGARGSINLASKLLLTLLPPGDSSFNLNVPVRTLMEQGVLSPPPEIVKGLAQCEQLVNAKIESLGWRRPTFVSLLHLVIAGNVCEYILPDGRIKLYRLDQFVCVRDWSGAVLEVITCEAMKVRALPPELRERTRKKDDETAYLYTRFTRKDDRNYEVEQALDDVVVKPSTSHTGLMPCNALGWDLAPGEPYARSHVEANFADLDALDATSKHIREGGALAARHLILVRPNAAGGNLRKRIAEARNGATLAGNPEDVNPFQFQNGAALQTLKLEKEDLKRDLAQAFLMTGDLRRDAERVTAYELRMLVNEIESALGGTHSLLSTELQGWRIKKLMAQMKSRRELPDFGPEDLQITVTTGLEALGRDERLNKVRSFLELLTAAGQNFAEDVKLYVKFDEVLTPGAIALGFPQAIRTDGEVQQMRAQQQQDQMAQEVAGKVAGPLASAAAEQGIPA